MPDRSACGAGQSFTLIIDGSTTKRITIDENDTMDVLAARISNALGISGDADMAGNGDTEHLEIRALNGATVEIVAGAPGQDALAGLGLKPAFLIGKSADSGDAELARDASFELGIFGDFSLLTDRGASDAATIFENAMLEVKKAFRFLTEGPPSDDPFEGIIGPPSAYVAGRIAQFELAVQRLQFFNTANSGSLGILV